MHAKAPLAVGLLALSLVLAVVATAAPVVSNVTASRRTDGSRLVDIYYNLSGGQGSMAVHVVFSNDNCAGWTVCFHTPRPGGNVDASITNEARKHPLWDTPTVAASRIPRSLVSGNPQNDAAILVTENPSRLVSHEHRKEHEQHALVVNEVSDAVMLL